MIPVTKPLSLKGKFFTVFREGSLEILKSPSRFGSKLVYPRDIYEQITKDQADAGSRKFASRNRKST